VLRDELLLLVFLGHVDAAEVQVPAGERPLAVARAVSVVRGFCGSCDTHRHSAQRTERTEQFSTVHKATPGKGRNAPGGDRPHVKGDAARVRQPVANGDGGEIRPAE
jgi:hypothetical protein